MNQSYFVFDLSEDSSVRKVATTIAACCVLLLATYFMMSHSTAQSKEQLVPRDDLKPIGGNWYVKAGDKPIYLYRDGERFVDLFSYHMKD